MTGRRTDTMSPNIKETFPECSTEQQARDDSGKEWEPGDGWCFNEQHPTYINQTSIRRSNEMKGSSND